MCLHRHGRLWQHHWRAWLRLRGLRGRLLLRSKVQLILNPKRLRGGPRAASIPREIYLSLADSVFVCTNSGNRGRGGR